MRGVGGEGVFTVVVVVAIAVAVAVAVAVVGETSLLEDEEEKI